MKIKTTPSVVIRIILWLLMIVGGGILAIYHDYDSATFNNIFFHILSATIGLIILKYAFNAASTGGRELAKEGRSENLPRLETDKLVTSGIYSCMRHPMLFGLSLIPLAWGLILGSVTFIMIIAPIEIIFIIFMVTIFEEMEVAKKFKNSYQNYKEKVPMISFKKECLRKLFL